MAPHEWLRRARERTGLSLPAFEQRTGIRRNILDRIERGAFGELQSGLYGRSAIRAYAKGVGLNPDEVLAAVAPLLPGMEDPLDALARVRGITRRHRPAAAATTDSVSERPPRDSTRGAQAAPWRALAASSIDGALLAAIDLTLLTLTAKALRVPAADALAAALPALAVLFAVIAASYFLFLGGIRNATIGDRLMHVALEGAPARLDARAIVARASRAAMRESSIVLELPFDSLRPLWTGTVDVLRSLRTGAQPPEGDHGPAKAGQWTLS